MSAVTPFIQPIKNQGGTFYAFSSAVDDMNSSHSNNGKQFAFSKYALLNIPKIARPTGTPLAMTNTIQFDAIPGAFEYVTNDKTPNVLLAESFQNYCLNFEEMLRNFSNFDSTAKLTTAERTFFKWLKEIGAIRFREASTNESALTSGIRYTEEDESSIYKKVVQYIGEIDVLNSVKSSNDAYTEVYVQVPVKDGSTPLVLFSSVSDTNYKPGNLLQNSPADARNSDFLVGRNFEQTNPAGLDVHAFFDSAVSYLSASGNPTGTPESAFPNDGMDLYVYNPSTGNYEINWWFNAAQEYTYYTQPSAISGTFDDPSNQALKIKGVKNGVEQVEVSYTRSKLDGISLSFKESDYYPIASNSAISNFSDFNSTNAARSFDFNAVLVYYDVYDQNNPSSKVTNLFGVLFLNKVTTIDAGGTGEIKGFTKVKADRVLGTNGNSYGFKINLKSDVSSETPSIVSAINEYSTFSLEAFTEAISRLIGATNLLENQRNFLNDINKRLSEIESNVNTNTAWNSLTAQVNAINDYITSNKAVFENTSDLLDLINRNYLEITNIHNNKTSIDMAYNLSVINQGDGINIDKGTNGSIKISNSLQKYNANTSSILSIVNDFNNSTTNYNYTVNLAKYNNYMKLDNGQSLTFSKPIIIYINDTLNSWKNGQSFIISVDRFSAINLSSNGMYYLEVRTDARDILNNGQAYGKVIATISATEFLKSGGTPKIEFICLDSTNLVFTCDVY